MKVFVLTLVFTLVHLETAHAASENTKGLLSEIRMNEAGEDENQKKAFKSEVLITKTENKAIDALKQIIKKKSGTPEEADLLYRLAELYMRRAKSGRYFDLEESSENKLKELGIKNQRAGDALKQAILIYEQIRTKYPRYHDLDYVLFNDALAHAQILKPEIAKKNYLQLISQFPDSELVPDSLLEVGEIFYQQQNFQVALEKFRAIEKYPNSKAYPYGLYKSAWCYYNLKQTDLGINQLITVVKQNPADEKDVRKYNLRKEALRDLTLFVGETMPPNQLVGFFKKMCTEEELGDSIFGLTGLYESHSRFKELLVFVEEFISDYPQQKKSPQLYAKLIETYETLKLRDVVIKKLSSMAQYCLKFEEAKICREDFKKISLEISKKWWDIWLKNKSNAEFSQLTEKAFENLLSIDDEKQPDSKSRFAFAELLFQQSKFSQAAIQYELVSNHPALDLTFKHDALYGALFSIEKQLEKDENVAPLVEKQKQLALRYIAEFKNGEHFNRLTYKLGYIAYKQSQFDLSLSYLEPLVKLLKEVELKTKSEDIILDIYNLKKDYVTLQKRTLSFAVGADKERKSYLDKIQEESHYAQTQLDSKGLAVPQQIELLMSFSKAHPGSKLSQEAFWQSISIAYANGLDVQGAELSLEYVKKFPQDARNQDAIKESIKAFIDAGQLEKAIATLRLQNSSANNELICELSKIQLPREEARKCYMNLFKSGDLNVKKSMIASMLKMTPNIQSADYREMQNQINTLAIEPYATQNLINQANSFLDSKDFSKAFNLSLKINARPVDEDTRAAARLIQAKILEGEFVAQSVKAHEDKLSMVIAMKTEKMDKSFTAFSSALKMSKTPEIQLQALQGIDRLYTHYIDSISRMPLPETLSEADRASLRAELEKVTVPFKEKQKNNAEKLAAMNFSNSKNEKTFEWSKFPIDKSPETSALQPSLIKMADYFPADFPNKANPQSMRLKNMTRKCNESEATATNIAACVAAKNWKAAEALSLDIASSKPQRAFGLYYVSLVAAGQGNTDKALWFINRALELAPNMEMALYQKAKVLFSVEEFNTGLELLEKLINTKSDISEVLAVMGSRRFSEREFKKTIQIFSGLTSEELYNYGVDLMNIESKLQTGDLDQALQLAETSARFDDGSINLNLLFARIFESFKFDKEKALNYYNRALVKSKNADQKEWLVKKIDFLKTNKNNQIMSYVGGQK